MRWPHVNCCISCIIKICYRTKSPSRNMLMGETYNGSLDFTGRYRWKKLLCLAYRLQSLVFKHIFCARSRSLLVCKFVCRTRHTAQCSHLFYFYFLLCLVVLWGACSTWRMEFIANGSSMRSKLTEEESQQHGRLAREEGR